MNFFGVLIVLTVLSSYESFRISTDGGEKLKDLRAKMVEYDLDAYIIPSEDEHQSEYVANYDKRRGWISGFDGSAGVAVVTLYKAALWTDSRYFIRAEEELDHDYWILQKSGEPGVPSIENWLISELDLNSTVGQSAKLTSISSWNSRFNVLTNSVKKIQFLDQSQELIDLVWIDGRELKGGTKIVIHDAKDAGKTLNQKIDEVITRMQAIKADIFVVSALDEVAWLLNLRGTDIPYNPMFFAYFIVSVDKNHVIYIDPKRITDQLRTHLTGIQVKDYQSVFDDVAMFSKTKRVWVSPMSSYAIYKAVENKVNLLNTLASPVRSIKAVKNSVEIEKTRACQIRDSIHRVRHLYWLENGIKNGDLISEISSAGKLEEIQSKDALFRGLSFDSISAVGEHAADIHYSTTDDSNILLKENSVYLLDAGAHYEDCSTDIARTHHFGTPTKKEILAYTLVMKGSIDLAKLVFPGGSIMGRTIDVVARAPLWSYGLDYGHGTGHGIGYFSCIHEAPPSTSYTSTSIYDEPLKIGMFTSDEPGYYEEGNFGIRLETDIEVVKASDYTTLFNEPVYGGNYLTFNAQTLIPFDKNLIDVSLLDKSEIDWLNSYNEKIRKHVGEYFKNNSEFDLYNYVLYKTEPFKYNNYGSNSGLKLFASKLSTIGFSLIFIILTKA